MLFFATKVGIEPPPKLLESGTLFLRHACAVRLGGEYDTETAAFAKLLRRSTKNLAGWMLVHVGEVLWVFSVSGVVMEQALADDITYECPHTFFLQGFVYICDLPMSLLRCSACPLCCTTKTFVLVLYCVNVCFGFIVSIVYLMYFLATLQVAGLEWYAPCRHSLTQAVFDP